MPIHDYHCPACGQTSELLVRSSSPEPTCPHCASPGLQRLVSAPAAPGTSQAVIASPRRAAARYGHFSNSSKAERGKLVR